ncbi:MAG: hypothetical protein EBU15_14055 [Betaproteobacteria bacterium]|nr:hypothetical protein [Betaproteobacteria bacterium]
MKKSFFKFLRQNFRQKNKNKKIRKASELSTENRKSFFLFFYTFSILSIFGVLEAAWFYALFSLKTTFLV